MSSHAILSASAAHRWINCPPSARLEEKEPDTTSDYAKEGTLAHEMAELKLVNYITPLKKATFTRRLNKLKRNEFYAKEMDSYTDEYLDYIKSILFTFEKKSHVIAEKRVSYDHVAPEGFGTADCIILNGDNLYIVDLKYGQGVPVSSEENSQMKLYALGALREYSMIYNPKKITMVVFQPRINNISEYTLTAEDLNAWGESIKETAKLAWEGEGECEAGEHCRFCKIRGKCRARSEEYLKIAQEEFKDPVELSCSEIGNVLKKAIDIDKWIGDLKAYAQEQILKGEDVPGWKVVEGRSIRSFSDIDAAFEVLQDNGYEEAMLYERKPLTLTAVEKLVTKKNFGELLSDYVVKPPGKPTLVVEADKRDNFRTTTAIQDFS